MCLIQLFQPLSHVASILTRGFSTTRRGHSRHSSKVQRDELESFNNALKSVSELLDIQLLDKQVLAHIKPCHVAIQPVDVIRPRLPWMVSHKSSYSFDRNKILGLLRTC